MALSLSPPADIARALTTSDRVERVVDGDTIIAQSSGRLRLIGMNTPETKSPAQRQGAPPQCYGPEASAEMQRLLPPGTPIRLETDVEAEDRYGRSLVYVYRQPDDAFINGELVQRGFARARSYKPNTRYDAFLQSYQEDARKGRRGLWQACEAEGPEPRRATPSAAVPQVARAVPLGGAAVLANPGDSKNCADFSSYVRLVCL